MESSNFPSLGFPEERFDRRGNVVYQCFFRTCRAALWVANDTLRQRKGYCVNLYQLAGTPEYPTQSSDRVCSHQRPIFVEDAFEAQLAINYLLQTHVPQEVTECQP